MITRKEKSVIHPVNYVHIDLDSFVLYSDSFNEVDSQLVEAEDIPEITENFREVLMKERQETESFTKQSAFQKQQKVEGQQAEITEQTKFQHLEEDEEGLWTMDFNGAVGSDGARIGIWVRIYFPPKTRYLVM